MSELLVYKASAGSGKTFTLAVEYIKLLIFNPRAYRQILAVTFTNKATAEMKERILSQLYGIQIGDKDSEAYLNRIKEETGKTEQEIREAAGIALSYMLHDYSRFRVETIDSFFQSVMRNLARELELSPNLNIELNNTEVLSDAVDSMIEKLGPTSPVLAWLLDYINERIADDKRWNVSDEVKSFGRNIFDEGYIEKGEGLRQRLRNPNTIKEYRKQLKALETEILEQMKGFYDHLLLVGKVEDVLDGFLPVLGTLLDDACCDFFVVQTACDACASGVVAFLFGHDVVVKVNIERDFFVCCHDNDCFKESEYLFISYVLCCLSFRTYLDSITVQIKFEITVICHAPSSISHQMELHKITVSQGVAVGSLNNGFGSWPDSGTTQHVII